MTMLARLREKRNGNLATAIPAISATQPKEEAATVARIATVAVANPKEEKTAPPAKVGAGDTATLVAFWATWCPVCKAEEDNIVAVAKEHRVIPVAMQSGDAATVLKHLQERGIDLPQLIDADGRHAMNWRVRGVPTHFVVDAAGNVRFRVVGYATTWGLKARLWWAETFPA